MTVLSVVQQVTSFIGVARPTALFPNLASSRTAQELADLATEMAQRIAYNTREWQKLKTQMIFVGNGQIETFPMPSNYQRMLLTTNVWRSTSAIQPMRFIPDADEWVQRRARGINYAWGEWIILAGGMHIWPILAGYHPPAPAAAETATFMYLDKNCVNLAGGGRGDTFMADGDSFVLDERLLKLGMIWQWKANKGSPYAEDMANYADALAVAQGADKPAPIIVGSRPVSSSARVAYPYPIDPNMVPL